MKTLFGLACLCLCPFAALGQTVSAHSGWSFSDTTSVMTDVVVADIISGTRLTGPSRIAVKATVRVVRVLQGSLAAGTELALAWEYSAMGPDLNGPMPTVRGLFLLRKQGEGFEPLMADMMPQLGGYFLEVPRTAVPGGLWYMPEQATQIKIAHELTWALQEQAIQEVPARTSAQFQRLAMTLEGLDRTATLDTYQYLSMQQDARLKMVGLQGRLAGGDASAIFEIEQELPRLAPAANMMATPPMGLNLSRNLPAAHALARIALSDTPVPGWEGALPMILGSTHAPEFLPYFLVMFDSPSPYTRGSAIDGFCQLLRQGAFWQPDMQASCPQGLPMNDPVEEQRDVAFWRQWYTAHLTELSKAANLPQVIAPARYSAAPAAPIEITLEMRLQAVVSMSNASFTHSHGAGGEIVAGSPPDNSEMFTGKLTPSDREIFHRIVDGLRAKLDQADKLSSDLVRAALGAGQRPGEQKLRALEAQRETALQSGLQDLRNQLSPDGWNALEGEMKRMSIGVGRTTAPRQ